MELKDKKTKVHFHNGVLTIGGTIIEIAYGDSHIFFDFGSEYRPEAPFQPTNLQELLDEGLVPYVNNIFDPSIKLKGYSSTEDNFHHRGVFLSHVHLDHSKIINYLNPEIPLYTLEGTKSLLETLNINNNFLFPLENNNGRNVREIIGVKENEEVQIGEINVKVMPVDHDAYGSCGLLITTPDLTISYTGDIRIHGYRENATRNFCKASYNCDILLIEGVSVSHRDVDEEISDNLHNELLKEEYVIDKIKQIIEQNPSKQLTFNYYISNIERIQHIIEMVNITKKRTVVLDAYYAYVLKDATGEEAYYYQLDNTDYGLDPSFKIDFDTLLQDENKYFWQLDTLALQHLDKLKTGGIYIHSNAVPLGEFDPNYAPFVKQFEEKNIEFMKLSCSGHAFPKDLIKIINLISPKLLIPIHSKRPDRLYN
ncbi:MAG: MBL fold metallo-hydrolase, partial [Epulopiscium sp. Nele67-Bin005]